MTEIDLFNDSLNCLRSEETLDHNCIQEQILDEKNYLSGHNEDYIDPPFVTTNDDRFYQNSSDTLNNSWRNYPNGLNSSVSSSFSYGGDLEFVMSPHEDASSHEIYIDIPLVPP